MSAAISAASDRPWTVQATADRLGISTSTLYKIVGTDELPAVNTGTGARSHWSIPLASIEAFEKRRQRGRHAAAPTARGGRPRKRGHVNEYF